MACFPPRFAILRVTVYHVVTYRNNSKDSEVRYLSEFNGSVTFPAVSPDNSSVCYRKNIWKKRILPSRRWVDDKYLRPSGTAQVKSDPPPTYSRMLIRMPCHARHDVRIFEGADENAREDCGNVRYDDFLWRKEMSEMVWNTYCCRKLLQAETAGSSQDVARMTRFVR
ncbi:MAG: hypothetical protein OXF02_02860 [Simkaniaceae bacterium]|nr:hypothetical protein [Simkaniaceae bacterium]